MKRFAPHLLNHVIGRLILSSCSQTLERLLLCAHTCRCVQGHIRYFSRSLKDVPGYKVKHGIRARIIIRYVDDLDLDAPLFDLRVWISPAECHEFFVVMNIRLKV